MPQNQATLKGGKFANFISGMIIDRGMSFPAAFVFQITILATLNLFSILGHRKIKFMFISFSYEQQKTELGTFFQSISLNFNKMEINKSSDFEAGNDFDFLAHKSATTDQISANSVSTFKSECLILNILETEKIGFMAALQ